ncbi:uncharacterized protein G2W53_036202 [Senna tora]|uniref:Uncharacterized protein n=1 Tax=Senna tora TaxID=362788 RepID=A0A834T4L2_9FABA|nr:uncharacterized protein G2W53_036202 [Senna tora]
MFTVRNQASSYGVAVQRVSFPFCTPSEIPVFSLCPCYGKNIA